MEDLQSELKNIISLAISMTRAEMEFSTGVKQIFKDLMVMLDLDSDTLIQMESEANGNTYPKIPEGKVLLMDILFLTILSHGDLQKQQIRFLLNALNKIGLKPEDYIVFPFFISFEKLHQKPGINFNHLFNMLWSKVSHCMRNRIFFPQWSDTMSCFLRKIDQQHKHMIQSFANYVMKLNSQKSFDEIKKMLKELQNYSNVHFKTEEAYMKKVNFPLLSEHLEAHQEFLQLYKNMLIEYSAKKNIEQVKDRIAGFLSWFLNHVREKDVKMGFFVKVKKFSTIKKNHILLYHDNQSYADQLKEALNDLGFESVTLSQKENEAFDWISTGDISACLISSDQPAFSGIGLLQKTRKNHLNIPIFLLPLKENQADLRKNIKKLRLEHKANLFLMRPFGIESIIYRLDQTLFPSFTAGKG